MISHAGEEQMAEFRKALHARLLHFPRNLAPDFPQYINGNEKAKTIKSLIEKEI
jgi:hypothetical protein